MSGVVDVRCAQCPILYKVWWMSFFTHGMEDVWCGGCLVGGCHTISLSLSLLQSTHLIKRRSVERVLSRTALYHSQNLSQRFHDDDVHVIMMRMMMMMMMIVISVTIVQSKFPFSFFST